MGNDREHDQRRDRAPIFMTVVIRSDGSAEFLTKDGVTLPLEKAVDLKILRVALAGLEAAETVVKVRRALRAGAARALQRGLSMLPAKQLKAGEP